ncbi:MAG TPA: trypsin-like peptidase domain-containing protein [Xanthobacteraceae bacterium]|nr:trypsin-like peptidase domain-containing protein [Xanthobacteraceae bacterium]
MAEAVRQAGRSVVTVHCHEGLAASGVHWRRGVIVTADHVLDRDAAIRVELPDGSTVRATLAGRDQRVDLAVLQIRAVGLPTAQFGDAASLRVGHMVLAVGRHSERGLSASWGVVSAFGRGHATVAQGSRSIYLDLTIYPGFSGGPLVADGGRIVGINTLAARGAAHSIPNAVVEDVVGDLLQKEYAWRR